MRNGLAVAGIAGGLWFLGNAVANADSGTATTTTGGAAGQQLQSNQNPGTAAGPITPAPQSNQTNQVGQQTTATGTGNGSNGGGNSATQTNQQNTTTANNPNISNGGNNSTTIDASIHNNTINCPQHEDCTVNLTTNVTVIQQANGGTATNSGNMGVNAPVPGPCNCQPAPPCPQKHPVVKSVALSPAALSSAQPSGVLATTGAEFGVPLTVGLIALTAGTGLTLAGRRRAPAAA